MKQSKQHPLRRIWIMLLSLVLGITGAVMVAAPAQAATPILSGSSWFNGGGVNICSATASGSDPSCGGQTQTSNVTPYWQCVELAQRFYKAKGWYSGTSFAGIGKAYLIYDNASSLGMTRQANGNVYSIVPGDMIVHASTEPNSGGAGHVSIVDSISGSTVNVVEQNGPSANGRATYNWSNGTLSRGNSPIKGVVHDQDNTSTAGGAVQPEPDQPGRPVGDIQQNETFRAPGGVQLRGWAADLDTSASIDVHFYAGNGVAGGGNPMAGTTANIYYPPVDNAYPGVGPYHKFDKYFPLPLGNHHICGYGLNAPGTNGSNRRFDCLDIVISPDPFGFLDTVTPTQGGVTVTGWAIDPDTGNAIDFHVYGGSGVAGGGNPMVGGNASGTRSDVQNAWPMYGAGHGFTKFLSLSPGTHTVCGYALNYSGTVGANQPIGCKTVTVT